MKGYKAFNSDLTCRGMQYEVGKSYSTDEKPVLCKRGFHFCETIRNCSEFYKLLDTDNRVCEVEASEKIKHGYDKCVTNRLFIVRELSRSEINRGLYIMDYGYGNGYNGYGSGYSYGDGYGSGYSYGYGDGDGYGAGSGYSYGDGDGYGSGYSYGYGDGDRYDDGNGYGEGAITSILNFK